MILQQRSLFVVAAAAILAACNGSNSNAVPPPIATATAVATAAVSATPTPRPASASGTLATSGTAPSTITLGPIGPGNTGTANYPPTNVAAHLSVAFMLAQPSGLPTVAAVHRVPKTIGGSAITPFGYFQVTADVGVPNSPAFAMTFPAGVAIPTAATSYAAIYDPGNAAAGWSTISGPAALTGNTLAFTTYNSPYPLVAARTYTFVLFTTSTTLPVATPAPSTAPSTSPSPAPLQFSVAPVNAGYLRGDATGLRLWGEGAEPVLISSTSPVGGQTITVTSSDPKELKVTQSANGGTFILQAVTGADPSSKCPSCMVVTPAKVSLLIGSSDHPLAISRVPVQIDHKIIYVSMNPNPNPSFGGIDALLQYYDDNGAPSVIWDDFSVRNSTSIFAVAGLAVGADGTLYVGNAGDIGSSGAVTEYPSGTTNPTPAKTLSSPLLVGPTAVAVDAHANVYAVDGFYETLTRFQAGGLPVTLRNNWPSGSGLTGVAVDANGNLIVSMTDSFFYDSAASPNVGALAVMPGTFATTARPIFQINSSASNGVNQPYAVAVAPSGDLYVVNDYVSILNQYPGPGPTFSTLTRYAHGLVNSTTIPDATISAGLAWPLSVAVDIAGTVYLANNNIWTGATLHTQGSPVVITYPAKFTSNATPLSRMDVGATLPAAYKSAFLNIQGVAVYPGPLQN
ncbi:MAG: pknD 5 [Candidatus Eremiobacteraeota bacterium]|nr:pknD 5 [Candidatus Eremiobacteraeota bacterium]